MQQLKAISTRDLYLVANSLRTAADVIDALGDSFDTNGPAFSLIFDLAESVRRVQEECVKESLGREAQTEADMEFKIRTQLEQESFLFESPERVCEVGIACFADIQVFRAQV